MKRGVSLSGELAISSAAEEIELILKLGKHDDMKALFEDGVVYMNTLEFYRTLEAHDERSDVNEGTVRVRNRRGGVLKRRNSETGAFEEIAQLTRCRIRELNSNLQDLNVYCLYYLRAEMPINGLGALISERTKRGFGDYAVVVIDAGEFVARVKRAAMDKGYRHFRSLVRYADLSKEEIETGPFVKHEAFSHQSELRIAVHTGDNNGSAIKLKIGSIEDIAVLVPSRSLDELSFSDQANNALQATRVSARA